MAKKRCPQCQRPKDPSEFHVSRSRSDGLETYCKPCKLSRTEDLRARTKAKHAPEPGEPVIVLPPLEAAQHHHKAARAARDLKVEHSALLEEVNRQRVLLDALKPLEGSTPHSIPKGLPALKGEAVPLILASDWHVEEEVDPLKMHGVNAFTLEIARARAQKFAENALRLVKLTSRDSLVRRVVVGLLGDLFSNSIHLELMEVNQLGPQPAARFAKDLLVGVINYWLANSDPSVVWEFFCVGGNHGRMTEKTRISTNAENSLEIFAYYFLAAEFKGNPRVKFTIAPGDMLYADVFPDFRIRFIHGDQIKFGGGVGGLTIPLNKWISRQNNSIRAQLTCLGHFHQRLDGGDFLVNGSLIGASPYSQRFGFSPEPPAQQFALIHSRTGGCKSIVAPIWVSDSPLT